MVSFRWNLCFGSRNDILLFCFPRLVVLFDLENDVSSHVACRVIHPHTHTQVRFYFALGVCTGHRAHGGNSLPIMKIVDAIRLVMPVIFVNESWTSRTHHLCWHRMTQRVEDCTRPIMRGTLSGTKFVDPKSEKG